MGATRNVDWFLLLSEAKLKAKVALQRAGVIGKMSSASQTANDPRVQSAKAGASSSSFSSSQAAANRHRDERAASSAHAADIMSERETPVDRVLEEPETRVSEEGTNLLHGSRAE